jgi:Protein of unknown function (DUF4239)
MTNLLYNLSDVSIALLFSAIIALVFVVSPLLRERLFGEISDSTSDFVRATMTPITGFTGVVLAFSLVQAQGNLRNVERTVAIEAMQLNQVDRLLISYGPDLGAVRQTARDYAQSVVSDEWPRLSNHSSSDRSAELFRSLSQEVLSIQPTVTRENVIYGDLVKMIDQLAESREDRLAASDIGLPSIFWEVIGSLVVLLIGFCGVCELAPRDVTWRLGGRTGTAHLPGLHLRPAVLGKHIREADSHRQGTACHADAGVCDYSTLTGDNERPAPPSDNSSQPWECRGDIP